MWELYKISLYKGPEINPFTFHNETSYAKSNYFQKEFDEFILFLNRGFGSCASHNFRAKIATWLKGTDREVSPITAQLSTYGWYVMWLIPSLLVTIKTTRRK